MHHKRTCAFSSKLGFATVSFCLITCKQRRRACKALNAELLAGGPIEQVSDMGDAKLLKTVERWLRTERNAARQGYKHNAQPVTNCGNGTDSSAEQQEKPATKPAPYFPSRHMAYFH